MTRVKLGCIADDYTGATDLASMLVRVGLQVVQLFDVPPMVDAKLEPLKSAIAAADALVIALKTRSVSPSRSHASVAECSRVSQVLQRQSVLFQVLFDV